MGLPHKRRDVDLSILSIMRKESHSLTVKTLLALFLPFLQIRAPEVERAL